MSFPAHVATRSSTQDFGGGAAAPFGINNSPLEQKRNLFPVQFRNVDVGMFSGRRPSYQRYSASPAAYGVINKTEGVQ
jgi:hypothetical protein